MSWRFAAHIPKRDAGDRRLPSFQRQSVGTRRRLMLRHLALEVAEAVSLLAVPGGEPAIAAACLAYLAAYWTASSAITLLKSR